MSKADTVKCLGFLSHLTTALWHWPLRHFHIIKWEGSEWEAISWDGKRGEVERETDYVWLLMSDPITFISWSWWTHTGIDGSKIPIWIYYNLDLRVKSVCGLNQHVCVCWLFSVKRSLVTNVCDYFVFVWKCTWEQIKSMPTNTHPKTQINTHTHIHTLRATNWKPPHLIKMWKESLGVCWAQEAPTDPRQYIGKAK